MAFFDFLHTIPAPGTSAFKAYTHVNGITADQGAMNYAEQQAIPPEGTSAYKAYQYQQRTGSSSTDLIKAIEGDANSPSNPSPTVYGNSASGYSPSAAGAFDFLNADLAEYYGMSKATAYQEALANTAYQRAVADLKAAGLNPSVLFGNGRVQSANAGIYGQEAVRGSGGYSRRGSGSKGSGNGKLFSTSAYGALAAIGGLVGIAATGRPDGFWIGSQTAQGAMNLMNAFHQNK